MSESADSIQQTFARLCRLATGRASDSPASRPVDGLASWSGHGAGFDRFKFPVTKKP